MSVEERDNEHNPVLGIDLGTTFSAVARWDGRGASVYQIGNDYDLQSVVYYDPKRDQFLVGKLAFRKGNVHPENMILGVKRFMDDANKKITLGDREFSPIQISALILEKLYKELCDKFPKGKFQSRGTVVTVPYYFKAHQCENTRAAAKLANIECLGILQEPIAASLSYAWQIVQDHPEKEVEENILVFDLGGGTFDLTLFKLHHTSNNLLFEVVASGGDDRLGGMDFDNCLIEFFREKGKLVLDGLAPLDFKKAEQKLREQAIEAKLILSAIDHTYVSAANVVGDQHLDTEISRDEFDSIIKKYVERIGQIIDRLFVTSGMAPSDVHRVIRVGGSSQIPCIKKLLEEKLGEEKIYGNVDPSKSVAEGAAFYAAYLDDHTVLGRRIEIRTRTSHGLGVGLDSGDFCVLIPGNRKTPCEQKMLFTTSDDNQTSIDIEVYQGSSKQVKDNSHVGTLSIPNLPAKSKGELDIEVTFKVTQDQSLAVIVEVEGMRKSATLNFT